MSKRQEMREKRHKQERMQRVWIIVVLVVIALVVVGGVIWSQRPVEGIVPATPVTRQPVDFNTAGDPNAPVKIIEYADFQCPYCLKFWTETEPQLIKEYVNTGKVYFEFRSVGKFLGLESARAAEAAYCAGDQQKFWEMHDTIFANQGAAENAGALNDAHLVAMAKIVPGLDMTQFNVCFATGKYAGKVAQDGQNALKDISAASNYAQEVAAGYPPNGVATPTFLINGKLVSSVQAFSEFQKVIDAALAAAGQ